MKAKRIVGLSSVAVLALGISACGDSGGGGSSNTPETNNPETLAQTAWVAADYDDVNDGGTLTLPIDQLPDNYNGNQLNGTLQSTYNLEEPVLGGPVTFKADGSWFVDPDYAESIELVSKDPEKIEVKLNPKAVWADGTPITYKDMVATWHALSGEDPAFEVAATNGFQDIGNVEKGADDFSYTVTFKKTNADWPNYIYPTAPVSVNGNAQAFNTGFTKKMFPGNGPYIISNIDANAQVITETPNPKWWGEKPKLDKIIWRVIDQSAWPQAFANKEINAVQTDLDKDAYDTASKRADAEIQRSNGLTWTHLTFNMKRPPFDDPEVRKAIGMGIDRETMAKVIFSPVGAPAQTQGSYIYMPGQAGYEDNATPAYGYDPEKAEQTLTDAGWTKNSSGLYEKDGKPLTMNIVVPADTPTNFQRAQLIQGFMKKIGVTVTLQTVPAAKYFVDYVAKGNFDAVTFSWQGTAFPVSTSESLFYPADSGQNYAFGTDDSLGALWDAANGELDPTKQAELAQEIDKTIASYVPMVTIAPTPTIWAVETGLVNYGASQFESIDWTKVGFVD